VRRAALDGGVRWQTVRGVGVAESAGDRPDRGEARLLASAALMQQAAQVAALVALLVIVTVLARRLAVAELGAYGLVASLAGYLLVLRNSVASSTVRAMAGAPDLLERGRMFSAAATLYVGVGAATGLLIAAMGLVIAGSILSGELASHARLGALGLGAVTAVGIAVSVHLDALRAERLLVRAATIELMAVAVYLTGMLALILGGSGLAAVIAASGALPLLSGLLSLAAVRRLGLPFRHRRGAATREHRREIVPTAGWLLVVELSTLTIYGLQRVILGAYRSPVALGLFEGPVRAHNLFYALGGAIAVPTVPTASRYVAIGDRGRLSELAVRGTRYTLALFVPLCVTLMVLAASILDVWLGNRYGDGEAALAILVSYWLLYGGLAVTPGFLVGAGRAREVGLLFAAVAVTAIVLSLLLTPKLGLEGPALATAIPFIVAFPLVVRLALLASGASLGQLVSRAWAPNYLLGAALASLLVLIRLTLDPDTLTTVLVTSAGGLIAYWSAFYALVLDRDERAFARGLLRRAP
jgi:O-antigen/teichoic acid export membrane protein